MLRVHGTACACVYIHLLYVHMEAMVLMVKGWRRREGEEVRRFTVRTQYRGCSMGMDLKAIRDIL